MDTAGKMERIRENRDQFSAGLNMEIKIANSTTFLAEAD